MPVPVPRLGRVITTARYTSCLLTASGTQTLSGGAERQGGDSHGGVNPVPGASRRHSTQTVPFQEDKENERLQQVELQKVWAGP